MMNPDEALLAWAAEETGRPVEEIDTVDFGYRIECWSEVTHEYGVYATIYFTDGKSVETKNTWSHVLEGIAAYRQAEVQMYWAHGEEHRFEDEDEEDF